MSSVNAAMQTEPPQADRPKRKRRWFQFSLRTLMIVVTLLAVACGYVGWQAKIVRERRAMVDWINNHNGLVTINYPMPRRPPHSVASVRELLGDHAIVRIELQPDTDATNVQRIRSLFPEATIKRWSDPPGSRIK
jgi:hypothetical protein